MKRAGARIGVCANLCVHNARCPTSIVVAVCAAAWRVRAVPEPPCGGVWVAPMRRLYSCTARSLRHVDRGGHNVMLVCQPATHCDDDAPHLERAASRSRWVGAEAEAGAEADVRTSNSEGARVPPESPIDVVVAAAEPQRRGEQRCSFHLCLVACECLQRRRAELVLLSAVTQLHGAARLPMTNIQLQP